MPDLGAYTHGHVPSPLRISDHVGGDTPREQLLREILILTKLNWNSANLGGLMPITLRFSRLVGDVLRCLMAQFPGRSSSSMFEVRIECANDSVVRQLRCETIPAIPGE